MVSLSHWLASSAERTVVIKDASYRDGLAGLAVIGDLGVHTAVVAARDATDAEEQALRLAMRVAERRRAAEVDFVSDRNPTVRGDGITEMLDRHPGWRIVAVPRGAVWQADRLARKARLAAVSPTAAARPRLAAAVGPPAAV